MATPPGNRVTLNFNQAVRPDPTASVELDFNNTQQQPISVSAGDQSQFGTPQVRQPQFLRPAGINQSGIGQHHVAKDALKVFAQGIAPPDNQVPSGWQVKWRQFITATSVADISIVPATGRVALAGGYYPPPGSSITLNFLEPNVPPPGASVTLEFGAAGYGRILSVTLGDTSAFGTPGITQQIVLQVPGIPPGGFGVPNIETGNRTINLGGQGIAPPTGQVSTGGQVRLLAGVIAPAGIAPPSAQVPTGASVTHYTRTLTATGIAAPSGQVPTGAWVSNYTRYVTPTGIAGSAYGNSAWVSNYTRYLLPAGIAATAFGTTKVELKNRTLQIPGFAATVFGTAKVENAAWGVFPTGIAPPGMGTPTVSFRVRTLSPVGFNAISFGVPWISLHTRYVQAAGFANAAYGKPWVHYPPDARLMNFAPILMM